MRSSPALSRENLLRDSREASLGRAIGVADFFAVAGSRGFSKMSGLRRDSSRIKFRFDNRVYGFVFNVVKASFAAPIVFSTSCSEWAVPRKAASYCDGGK
jgi:hypothetical protein